MLNAILPANYCTEGAEGRGFVPTNSERLLKIGSERLRRDYMEARERSSTSGNLVKSLTGGVANFARGIFQRKQQQTKREEENTDSDI